MLNIIELRVGPESVGCCEIVREIFLKSIGYKGGFKLYGVKGCSHGMFMKILQEAEINEECSLVQVVKYMGYTTPQNPSVRAV